jgi:hypothetical protein
MKTLFGTKKEVKKQAQRFELKGRSKIETTEQLLKAMKEQGFEKERKILMSVNRRLKNLHSRTQDKIKKLPYFPENPLKGHGHKREEYSYESLLNSFWIPEPHMDEISSRRQKGYFSWSKIISPELYSILIEHGKQAKKIRSDFFKIKTPYDLKIEQDKKDKEEEMERQNEKFTNMDGGQILTEFFKKESHPAPEHVLNAKYLSGKSWNELREMYKG